MQYQSAASSDALVPDCERDNKQQAEGTEMQQALVCQASQKVLQVLIDFIISFIQQNKQSIIHSMTSQSNNFNARNLS